MKPADNAAACRVRGLGDAARNALVPAHHGFGSTRYNVGHGLNGSSNCFGSGGGSGFRATSCFVGQALALDASERNVGAAGIVNAKLGAGILPKVELGQIAVKMALIDVLINADDAALEHAEKPFERVGVHVATHPLEFGVIDGLVFGKALELVVRGLVGHEAAILMRHKAQVSADATMIERHGANVATAFDKAKHLDVIAPTMTGRAAGMPRPAHFGFVGFNRLASAAKRASIRRRSHGEPDTMAQKPRRFHAAIEHPLDLTGGDAFLAATEQVNDLEPKVQRQVRGLKIVPIRTVKGFLQA